VKREEDVAMGKTPVNGTGSHASSEISFLGEQENTKWESNT